MCCMVYAINYVTHHMQTFDWTTFTKKIAIQAPVDVLYNAWAKAGEIQKWFLKEAVYTNANGNKLNEQQAAAVGDTYTWIWFLYPDIESGKITTANGTDHFQFTFAGNCVVDVRFTPHNDKTIVELTQSNIPTDDKSRQYIRLGCASGWAFYLINLKSVYEGGLDLRGKDETLPPMINN